jgi:hypothetical protein
LRLTLRVHGPGVVAAGERRCALLAHDREAGAAADARIVPLNADLLFLVGLAGIVDGEHVALQVYAVPIVRRREVLARVAVSALCGELKRVHLARADRFVRGLQNTSRILSGRTPKQQGRHDKCRRGKHHSQRVPHARLLIPKPEE